jgi:hypothetical protein
MDNPRQRAISLKALGKSMSEHVQLLLLIVVLTIASGFGDSHGFLHASRMWEDGQLKWDELAMSALCFCLGTIPYWLAIRFLQQIGARFAETQAILWFAVTMVGVALFSGKFVHWAMVDQAVALAVLAGVGWLLFRTGG